MIVPCSGGIIHSSAKRRQVHRTYPKMIEREKINQKTHACDLNAQGKATTCECPTMKTLDPAI